MRHRLLRNLVERHGFGAYAMESGFVEGGLVDAWGCAAATAGEDVMAGGMTSLMGLCTQMRILVGWLREHNRAPDQPVDHASAICAGGIPRSAATSTSASTTSRCGLGDHLVGIVGGPRAGARPRGDGDRNHAPPAD